MKEKRLRSAKTAVLVGGSSLSESPTTKGVLAAREFAQTARPSRNCLARSKHVAKVLAPSSYNAISILRCAWVNRYASEASAGAAVAMVDDEREESAESTRARLCGEADMWNGFRWEVLEGIGFIGG